MLIISNEIFLIGYLSTRNNQNPFIFDLGKMNFFIKIDGVFTLLLAMQVNPLQLNLYFSDVLNILYLFNCKTYLCPDQIVADDFLAKTFDPLLYSELVYFGILWYTE